MTTDRTPPTWFITGASSGIGLAVARAAARRGDNVVTLARDVASIGPLAEEHGQRVLALTADVRSKAAVDDAVSRAVTTFGRIDVVANNAGYGLFGAVEESTDAQARAVFDTNVFGLLHVLRATLPILRAQRGGHLVQGSSYYGRVAHPGVGLLAATKYAVEGLTDALVGELEPLGIRVTPLEPGPTATAFVANLEVAGTIDDYDRTVREVQKAIAALPPEAVNTPDRVAAALLAAVDAERPRGGWSPAATRWVRSARPCRPSWRSSRPGRRRPRPSTAPLRREHPRPGCGSPVAARGPARVDHRCDTHPWATTVRSATAEEAS